MAVHLGFQLQTSFQPSASNFVIKYAAMLNALVF